MKWLADWLLALACLATWAMALAYVDGSHIDDVAGRMAQGLIFQQGE